MNVTFCSTRLERIENKGLKHDMLYQFVRYTSIVHPALGTHISDITYEMYGKLYC